MILRLLSKTVRGGESTCASVRGNAVQSIRAPHYARIKAHMQGGVDRREKKENNSSGKIKSIPNKKEKQSGDGTMRGNYVRGGSINDLYSLAGCLVEDEDVALAKECACETEELFLAVRQVDLIHVRVEVALLKDHREKLYALERVANVLVGARAGWVGIETNAALEQ